MIVENVKQRKLLPGVITPGRNHSVGGIQAYPLIWLLLNGWLLMGRRYVQEGRKAFMAGK